MLATRLAPVVVIVAALAPRAAAADAPAPGPRSALLARLARLTQAGQFLFGQENGTVWGMSLDGKPVSTKTWYERTAAAGHFTSDVAAVTGDDPAVLGVSLGMLAYEPVAWNRRPVIAAAIRHQLEAGGVVTMDWHVPSCNSTARATATLDTVSVDGHDVTIPLLGSGSSFYTEEEYTRPIAARADVPDTLKCVCQIANAQPLSAGFHKGTSGRTWLIAQAKHAAKVLREQKLADAPIIVRPFHEQTGPWFWWGQPYWNCAALLGQPDAISGADAFKAMNRIYIEALRAEPGMGELLFAYSPDKLSGPGEDARPEADTPQARARFKLDDPSGYARDRLRERVVRELNAAGLSYVSPVQARITVRAAGASSAKAGAAYVAERRPYYIESYAGDDLFDVLGIDLYHPIGRAADARDLRQFGLLLRVVGEEARAHGKPHALTEAGTYRLPLSQIAAAARPG
ncbi:MAG TPA: glycosyl hydrolase, partial [Polyangia bacterium]|nr:glycosyl hydrolase [Polyangia bacterium]